MLSLCTWRRIEDDLKALSAENLFTFLSEKLISVAIGDELGNA